MHDQMFDLWATDGPRAQMAVKVVSTRVSDEMYQALVDLGNEKGINVSQVAAQAIQGAISGKVPLKSLGKRDICPRCGSQVHLYQRGNEIFFVCLNCDWAKRLGYYTFPGRVEETKEV